MGIIIAVILFSIIVLFHEAGHFLLAKANGIKVNEFCLGLGPKLVGITKGETLYSIHLLPFGGACVMEGEDEESEDERAFNNKKWWQKFLVVAAGPAFNFIMALLFAVILIGARGYMEPVISDIVEGYGADEAGLEAGDKILKINDKDITFYEEVSLYFIFHTDTVNVTYERDGEVYSTDVTPVYDEEDGRYYIGIYGASEYSHVGIPGTVYYGAKYVQYYIWYTFSSLKMLISGSAGLNDVSGVVGIVSMVSDTVSNSGGIYYAFLNLLNFGILLSANLGVINLLPFPALDGGRLVFIVIEAVRKKPFKYEWVVNGAGLVLLLLLMVIITAHDIWTLI